ncbi:MAG: EpsG family protein [Candidatus Saccharibacteria bacterium]|nr:EpsG family protein [Rhodoferax sp.]
MWPYWFLFLVPAFMAMTRLQPASSAGSPAGRWPAWWRVMFVLLTLMIGMRHQVGGDWFVYIDLINLASYQTLSGAMTQGDPAYSLLNWVAAKTDMGPYFANTVCAAIFSWGLVIFCRSQPRPWLAMVVAIPYLVTVVAMGYTRQGTAIGLAMVGLVALSDRKLLRFGVFVVLAALFHKSAILLMPLAALAGTRHRGVTLVWVVVSTAVFYVLLRQGSVDTLKEGYLTQQYQSQGAGIRVAMNAVPAVLFLWLRRRFILPEADRAFWRWMSLGALGFIGWLAVSSSSTAVDRVALYWIPLQLFVLSRLPDALGRPNGKNSAWVRLVVVYSATVLFVWLVFAQTAFAWLPYQFYPWVAVWG